MTTKLEQAARQALEALEVSTDWDVGAKGKQLQSMKAITALREALAEQEEPINKFDSILSWANSCPIKQPILAKQAEPSQLADASLEPVAWMNEERNTITWNELYPNMTPLYAALVRTKDLTDDEIEAINGCPPKEWVIHFARAVIAADREKNK